MDYEWRQAFSMFYIDSPATPNVLSPNKADVRDTSRDAVVADLV